MENKYFRGVHIDLETDTRLRLYAKKSGVSVSELLRNIIARWEKDENVTLHTMIDEVAKTLQTQWNHIMVFDNKFPKEVFILDQRKALRSLPESIVNLIIARYEENQRSANK